MALKNRTESKAVIDAWAAILDLEADHKPDLQTVLDNCIFRKDVATSTTASGTTKTLEFLNVDYIEVTQSNDVTYTLNNVQQGEVKYLKITKTANQTIEFSAATDVSALKSFINATTVVIYRITNKDGDLYIESINTDKDVLNNKKTIELEIGDWNMVGTVAISVNHGLSSAQRKTLRVKSVTIRDDDDLVYSDIGYSTNAISIAGWLGVMGVSTIGLERLTGGFYDNVNYNSTGYNRGWITLEYEP